MRTNLDHYVVLGVPRIADAAAIRAAYVGLAKRYHPDVATGDAVLAAANFRQITEAYETLSDPERRALYDSSPVPPDVHRIAPPAEYLHYVAARARRRRMAGIAAVAAAFLLLVGFLAVRSVTSPALEATASAAQQSAEEAAHLDARKDGQAGPVLLKGSQPSQPDRMRPMSSGPVGATAEARVLKGPPIEVTSGQSVCVGDDGAKFAITNRNGEPSVAYNGAAPVRASVQYAGKFLVLLTNIVPNDSVMIGIVRGEEGGTLLFHADERGNFGKPVGAKCEGVAF